MRVVVSGSHGLIGGALVEWLESAAVPVARLVRTALTEADARYIPWNPETAVSDPALLDGSTVVVHLAGENIAAGRWTKARKQRIFDSRIKSTKWLSRAFCGMERPPRVFVCASAVGYYGNRGDETLTENASAGAGFLADVCRAWEDACAPAVDAGVRVVNLRFGVVLSASGGALARMLPVYRRGLGGVLGDPDAWVSWISLADAVNVIVHAIQNENVSGPVNVVSPRPVTRREFTETLARLLGRSVRFPLPAFAVRLLLGEMAKELLLPSLRVDPARLLATGFKFRHPTIESALHACLGRDP